MVKQVKILKTEKTIEIQQVRPTDVCGKVLSDKYCYKSNKTSLLLSNVIDVDHQNSYLFTNSLRKLSSSKESFELVKLNCNINLVDWFKPLSTLRV